MIDSNSPFASFETSRKIKHTTRVYVLYCSVCHHIWKAPSISSKCINCKGNGDTARCLIDYDTEFVRT